MAAGIGSHGAEDSGVALDLIWWLAAAGKDEAPPILGVVRLVFVVDCWRSASRTELPLASPAPVGPYMPWGKAQG